MQRIDPRVSTNFNIPAIWKRSVIINGNFGVPGGRRDRGYALLFSATVAGIRRPGSGQTGPTAGFGDIGAHTAQGRLQSQFGQASHRGSTRPIQCKYIFIKSSLNFVH